MPGRRLGLIHKTMCMYVCMCECLCVCVCVCVRGVCVWCVYVRGCAVRGWVTVWLGRGSSFSQAMNILCALYFTLAMIYIIISCGVLFWCQDVRVQPRVMQHTTGHVVGPLHSPPWTPLSAGTLQCQVHPWQLSNVSSLHPVCKSAIISWLCCGPISNASNTQCWPHLLRACTSPLKKWGSVFGIGEWALVFHSILSVCVGCCISRLHRHGLMVDSVSSLRSFVQDPYTWPSLCLVLGECAPPPSLPSPFLRSPHLPSPYLTSPHLYPTPPAPVYSAFPIPCSVAHFWCIRTNLWEDGV